MRRDHLSAGRGDWPGNRRLRPRCTAALTLQSRPPYFCVWFWVARSQRRSVYPSPFRQLHRSPVMSIALPFVAFLLAGAFAAYHRLRLAWWAAITATLLVGCWLLGANPVATVIAGALTALIALPDRKSTRLNSSH